jgi:hypothetical protein
MLLCVVQYLVLEDLKSIPDDLYFEHLLSCSGKLVVLNQLLTELVSQNHKVCFKISFSH